MMKGCFFTRSRDINHTWWHISLLPELRQEQGAATSSRPGLYIVTKKKLKDTHTQRGKQRKLFIEEGELLTCRDELV